MIGQNFTSEKYFHGRPSATTDTDPNDATKTVPAPYNAANSSGSNLGPTSKALVDRVKDDTAKLQAENPGVPVPVDLVTTSASGLDPDITPAGALFQVPRVAKARGLSQDEVRQLVEAHISGRYWPDRRAACQRAGTQPGTGRTEGPEGSPRSPVPRRWDTDHAALELLVIDDEPQSSPPAASPDARGLRRRSGAVKGMPARMDERQADVVPLHLT